MNPSAVCRNRADSAPNRMLFLYGALLLAAGILLYLKDPALSRCFPPCPFRLVTGLYCPGCGSLKGIHQLMHGEIWKAFCLNPLMISVLPFLGYNALVRGVRAHTGRGDVSLFVPARSVWAFLAAVIMYGVIRNIPLFALAAPAP